MFNLSLDYSQKPAPPDLSPEGNYQARCLSLSKANGLRQAQPSIGFVVTPEEETWLKQMSGLREKE